MTEDDWAGVINLLLNGTELYQNDRRHWLKSRSILRGAPASHLVSSIPNSQAQYLPSSASGGQ